MRRINMNNRAKSVLNGILLIVLAVCLILWKMNAFNFPALFEGVSVVGLIVAFIMVVAIIQNIIDLHYGGIFIPLAISPAFLTSPSESKQSLPGSFFLPQSFLPLLLK